MAWLRPKFPQRRPCGLHEECVLNGPARHCCEGFGSIVDPSMARDLEPTHGVRKLSGSDIVLCLNCIWNADFGGSVRATALWTSRRRSSAAVPKASLRDRNRVIAFITFQNALQWIEMQSDETAARRRKDLSDNGAC